MSMTNGKCYQCHADRSEQECSASWLWQENLSPDVNYWLTEVSCTEEDAPSSSSNESSTPVAFPLQTGGHMGPPLPQYFDMRGNKVHGVPQTPGVYIVRTGSVSKTVVVK
jgi:hypothetical protein